MTRLTSLFAFFAVIFSFTFNSAPARADLPPAAWHCLSKDECIVAVVGTNVEVRRKGQILETITGMAPVGVANGWMTAMNGYIVTTWENNSNVYTYHIETGNRCEINTGMACSESIVFKKPWQTGYSVYMACQDSQIGVIILDTCEFIVTTNATSYASSIVLGRERVFVGDYLNGQIEVQPYINTSTYIIHTNQPRTLQVRYWTDPNTPSGDSNDILYFHTLDKIYKVGITQMQYQEVLFFDTFPVNTELMYMSVNATHLLAAERIDKAFLIDLANPSSYITLTLSNPKGAVLTPATVYVAHSGGTPETKAFNLQGNEISEWLTGSALAITYMAPIYAPVCGNNLQEDDPLTAAVEESCDGSDFDGKTCLTEGFDEGDLTCSQACSIDTTGCAYICGNETAAPTEECDGADLKGETCASQGYVSGPLSCSSSCEFDYSLCESCGNNIVDQEFSEICDGNDLNGLTCETFPGDNFTGGQLACASSCDDYDTSGCYTCGDNEVNTNEECDGANLNEQSCDSLGFAGGTLVCGSNCTFDVSECKNPPKKKNSGCNASGSSGTSSLVFPFLALLFLFTVRRRKT